MHKFTDLAATLVLAAILALGITCAWIVMMVFPTALLYPWFPPFLLSQLLLIIVALLSPLTVFIAAFLYVPLKSNGIPLEDLSHPLAFLPLLVLVALAFGLSARTYIRQKRVSENAMAWAIFVFFWGVPGYLGYLAHRRWPVVERCAHCNAETPRDRDDCLHCHTPFPPPARTGTEIFA